MSCTRVQCSNTREHSMERAFSRGSYTCGRTRDPLVPPPGPCQTSPRSGAWAPHTALKCAPRALHRLKRGNTMIRGVLGRRAAVACLVESPAHTLGHKRACAVRVEPEPCIRKQYATECCAQTRARFATTQDCTTPDVGFAARAHSGGHAPLEKPMASLTTVCYQFSHGTTCSAWRAALRRARSARRLSSSRCSAFASRTFLSPVPSWW